MRPVHYQACIALGGGYIRPVVVNAMTIEGHRRVAEQQGWAGLDRFSPLALGQGIVTALLGRGRFAIDNVLLIDQGAFAFVVVLVTHRDKQQRAGTPLLFFNFAQGGKTFDVRVNSQRAIEGQAAASPHAIAIVRRRQKTSSGRVAVRAEAVFAYRINKKSPMPEWRQGLAGQGCDFAQGRGDALDHVVTYLVAAFFDAAHPAGIFRRGHGVVSFSDDAVGTQLGDALSRHAQAGKNFTGVFAQGGHRCHTRGIGIAVGWR